MIGPKATAKMFNDGFWIAMIAEKTGMTEAQVEIQLMKFVRSLKWPKRRPGRPRKDGEGV